MNEKNKTAAREAASGYSPAQWNALRKHLLGEESKYASRAAMAESAGIKPDTLTSFILGRSKGLSQDSIDKLDAAGILPDILPEAQEAPDTGDGGERIVYRRIDDVRPHPANSAIYGDGADEDLVGSIREHGILTPLVLSKSGVLISGHRRLDGARKAGLDEVPTVTHDRDLDENDLEELLIEANRQRQKSNEQIGREFLRLRDIEAARARERMESGRSREGKGRTRDIVAAKIGVGAHRAEQAGSVVERIDELLREGKAAEAADLRNELQKSASAAHSLATRGRCPDCGRLNDSYSDMDGHYCSQCRTAEARREEREECEEPENEESLIEEVERLRAENAKLLREKLDLEEEVAILKNLNQKMHEKNNELIERNRMYEKKDKLREREIQLREEMSGKDASQRCSVCSNPLRNEEVPFGMCFFCRVAAEDSGEEEKEA